MSDEQFKELKDTLTSLDKRMEVGFVETTKQIDVGLTEVKGEIKRLEEKVEGIGKRLDQQEFISRSAVVGLIGGIGAGLVKYLFFS